MIAMIDPFLLSFAPDPDAPDIEPQEKNPPMETLYPERHTIDTITGLSDDLGLWYNPKSGSTGY
jgi:hypothetical protein